MVTNPGGLAVIALLLAVWMALARVARQQQPRGRTRLDLGARRATPEPVRSFRRRHNET
jgi:hypothetical protein